MTKSSEAVSELLKSSKHPFRGSDLRSLKTQQSRYERRKVKAYLRSSDWSDQDS